MALASIGLSTAALAGTLRDALPAGLNLRTLLSFPSINVCMEMVLRYFDGRRQIVLFLSASGNTLRFIAPERDDVVELSLCQGVWLSEANVPVEIEPVAAPFPDWKPLVRRFGFPFPGASETELAAN